MDVICQRCGTVNDYEVVLTPPPHYAKAICKGCDSFIKFLPNPKGAYKEICKQKLKAALKAEPNNKFIQSLNDYFDTNGFLTNGQFKYIEKYEV